MLMQHFDFSFDFFRPMMQT